MKPVIVLLSLFLSCLGSYGQVVVSGHIHSEADGELLPRVIIQNLRHSNINTISDTNGRYSLRVFKGDSVRMLLAGFQPRYLLYTGDNPVWFETVLMYPQSLVIDTVVIRKGMSKRQMDSLERYQLYAKSIEFKPAKVEYSLQNPFVILNPISGLVEKHTRYYKKIKRFKKIYRQQEGLRFVDTRYTPELVTSLTGLKDDALLEFMRRYEMPFDYAKEATDLEVKMWVKNNFREWNQLQKTADSLAHKPEYLKRP